MIHHLKLWKTVALALVVSFSLMPTYLLSQTPLTKPEKTGYRETSVDADVIDFLREVQLAATVEAMRTGYFGTTHEGREMPYVVLSKPVVTRPEQALESGKPIVFIMNNIHGGETDGKEASLMLIRDITQGKFSHWLDKMILLVVPVYNIDGNERIGKFHRMAQDGPEAGMGIRTNAAGFDLARDYMKVEQPEGKALARFFTAWWPHFTIDAHTNNGSYHDFAIEYAYPQNANVQPTLVAYLRDTMMPQVSKAVAQNSGFKSQAYGNFIDEFHPEKGWETYPSFPRYGDRYRGLQNRLSILIESYPYADFKSRIEASYHFMVGCLDYVAEHPDEILETVRQAEAQTIAAGNNPGTDSIGVRFKMVEEDKPLEIISFKIKETVDAEGKTHYQRTKEWTTYTVPYIGKSIATKKVARPYAYIIPKAYGTIARKLLDHGIAVETLVQPLETELDVYRITDTETAAQSYQGHHMRQLTAKAESRRMTLPEGTYVVRLGQAAGNVAAFLLEPETPDGYAAWNYFDNITEQSVVIVDDVLDAIGETLLADPEIRAEFDRLAALDPELKRDPKKRRDYLLAHSNYANPMRNIFPVYRLMHKTTMATMLVGEE